jgi:hypothetical protein
MTSSRLAPVLILVAMGGQQPAYAPAFDPASFVAAIDNPYLPLKPGTELHYAGTGTSRRERTVVTVTRQTKMILGVRAVVVRDQVFRDNVLIEDTFDWYAQDKDGNVWYLGEDTKEYKAEDVTSTAGSWEAGVNGAKAGIAMPANPMAQKGKAYRQEYLKGVAEDMGKVIAAHKTVRVPAATLNDCIETMDWSPLEPSVRESKMYCRGVGLVRETESPRGGSELTLIVRPNP